MSAEVRQYLSFFVEGSEYAVGILGVKEILQYGVVTRVPQSPACVRGVINLRGNVVPVIDLATRFQLRDSPVTKWTCIVIVETQVAGERVTMGVIADAVSQVIELAPADIEALPAFGTGVQIDY